MRDRLRSPAGCAAALNLPEPHDVNVAGLALIKAT